MSGDLEDRLREALTAARADARWAVAGSTTVDGVGRAGRTHRTRTRAGAAGALLVLAVGGWSAAARGGGGPDGLRPEVLQPAATAAPTPARSVPPAPVPGITPAFTPVSGRDWLLGEQEYARFEAGHRLPSPGPGQGVVPSPAPLRADSARLAAQAPLPEGSEVQREDDASGQPGTTALHVRLPDGTPVKVERQRLQTPVPRDAWLERSDSTEPGVPPEDVPGTSSALQARAQVGYGWPEGFPSGARGVLTVSADGTATSWYAPLSVPLEVLKDWAVRTEQASQR